MTLRLISLVAMSAIAISCSKNQQPTRQGFLENLLGARVETQATTLKIMDIYGKQVAGAQILIGTGVDQPFAENFISTSTDGSFTAPAGWTTPQAVTINAPGYVRATYFAQTPNGQTYTLRPAISPKELVLTGQTTGYKTVDKDGIVDFGVVIPSLTKATLFNFDIAAFISPQSDTISVIGRSIDIPKNIVLPKQRESYFFPIELNKPDYSLSFRSPGERMIYVARGTFPLDEVINEVRGGKEFYELTNYLSLKGGALRKIDIQANTALNLPVNELNYTGARQVTGPSVPADQVVLTAALSEWKGWFYPTDVKLLEAGKKRDLTIATGGNPSLISILKRKDEMSLTQNTDRLSAHFAVFDTGITPNFLPLMEKPAVVNSRNFKVAAVARPGNIFEGAQFSILSKVSTIQVAGKNLDVLENIWEVYAPEWMADTEIPQWPQEAAPTGKLRWEVTLTGLPNENAVQNIELGPKWLDAASHATRASQDF